MPGAPGPFGARLKALREKAGFTQEELAAIAGLSAHAVSALERGERRRPHVDTVRAICAALDLTGAARDAFVESARMPVEDAAVDEMSAAALPLPPTAIVGREADVRLLRDWLAEPAVRLVTLTGPGGVGKTRLALELARGLAANDGTRVRFVPLAATRRPEAVASAIAEALGLSDVPAGDLTSRARLACADRDVFLVLDNFEQVLGAAPIVADLLAAVASMRILVTSRAPLRIRGERDYAVRPLVLDLHADVTSPADWTRSPAVQLFVERVRDVVPDFRVTAANGPIVAAICRRLDALPLALEIAAPWIKVLTPEGLRQRLEHDGLLSTMGARDLPERQQTLTATVAWSYHLLDESEQRAFRRLCALPGGFSIETAAAALAGRETHASALTDALRDVATLIDKSLLVRANVQDSARARYYALEAVRAYAFAELTSSGELDDAMDGLIEHVMSEARLASEGLIGFEQTAWLERVREDRETYRLVLGWLLHHGRAVEAAEIAWRLLFFFFIRGLASEGARWYRQILATPGLPPAAEAQALAGDASMRYSQGELPEARVALERILAMGESAGDPAVTAFAELVRAHVLHAQGEVEDARKGFLRSIDRHRALNMAWAVGNGLSGLAVTLMALNDDAGATVLTEEAEIVLLQAGPWFRALTRYVEAMLALRRGDPNAALRYVRGSMTFIREMHDKFTFVNALVALFMAAVLKGDDEWAARIQGASHALTERTGVLPSDQPVHESRLEAERAVERRLGPDRWMRHYTAGRTASIDTLLGEIDRALTTP